ncbi:uncharacterized protein LOC106666281 [Cimex lectularius]|uniref:Uncharacterized protein n=1 Tax=Cimex lectularius TaxID=79782 RepID=A0A8I6RRL0_CIMLE|nr:uncharacterized protein LOC106666281 [Cimex lectularius]
MGDLKPYQTVYKGDYIWPYIAPIIFKPGEPPGCPPVAKKARAQKLLEEKKPCHCDRHSWSPHFERARHLKLKEQAFREAMVATAHKRTILENEILDHPCTDSEDVIASLYQLNFAKRNFPVVSYRPMMADHDDPVVTPVAMLRIGLDDQGYRDPTKFRSIAVACPDVGAPKEVTYYDNPAEEAKFRMRSEYQDTISKVGAETSKAALQFTEPLLTSRRRWGCNCL